MKDTNEFHVVRATAFGGWARALAIDATNVVERLRTLHGTNPVATAALGRVATGTLLLGAMLKEEDHLVTLRIQGGGPVGTLLASANGRGEVRATIGDPRPDVEQVVDGKLNVSGAVGRNGFITVTRDLGLREPYASTVEMISGEIGEDLAYYLVRSEQIPSAVGIGVFVRSDGSVEAAGGYLVQLLPGLGDDVAARVEEEIRALPHPTTMLRSGETPVEILERLFGDDLAVLDRRPVRFHCPCSRERAERALILLGDTALQEMRDRDPDDPGMELVCEFCTTTYRFSENEVDELITAAG